MNVSKEPLARFDFQETNCSLHFLQVISELNYHA